MAEEANSTLKDGGRNLKWMYEGTKSMVNREDYLLGKKIDKNFEMFSDVVVHDREDEMRESFFNQNLLKPSTLNAPQHKVSALDTRIVRTEDPLVALKFQEEQRRRQLLENPLLKLKAQRVLRKAFEKEMKKFKKKKEKRKRSSSSVSSSPSPEKKKEKRHHHSHRKERKKSESEEETERRHHSQRGKEESKRSTDRKERRRSTSASRTRRTPDRRSGERNHHTNHHMIRYSSSMHNKGDRSAKHSKKLTSEELEERRRAMLKNATWRDKMREQNLSEAADKLRKEQDEMSNNRSAGFMRPMMSTATEDSTIEKRLQSNRMNIQRQHDHMDKSFVRK